MLKKKLISITSAIVLVLSLFTLLPEGALKAEAASKLNIRTSFDITTGKLTITWDRYNSTCGYTIHYYNEAAEGPNQGQFLEMPDLSPSSQSLNGPTSFTTSDYFGQAYGNGGKKYKILIVCADNTTEYYREFSPAFETGTTILPAPQGPTLCENGLVFWNDDWDKFTELSLYNYTTNNRVAASTTQYNHTQYLIEDMTPGGYYYATIQNVARGNYQYRYSKTVTTNVAQYKGKTDVLGSYWEGTNLCWVRYPGAVSYTMKIQTATNGDNYTTVASNIPSEISADYRSLAVVKMDMKEHINKFDPGVKIRVVITAIDGNGNAISNATTTAPTTYKWLVGDVNRDGSITADDGIIVARYAANYGDYRSRYLKNLCDMNRDGAVTADDAIIIARYAANYGDYRTRYTKYV